MAYRLKDYLYNDKLTKEQNILMDRLYKLRMSGMAEAFEKQLLEPNTGLEPFEVRFAAIVNQEWDQRESKKFKRLMKKATLKYPAADLDSSIYDPERQLNTHVIELLAKCDWIDEPNNLLMTGGAGAGKTHIACALCITAMHQNCRKATIIISQIPVSGWYQLFGDSTYADACLSRMTSKAYRLEFPGRDRRITNSN